MYYIKCLKNYISIVIHIFENGCHYITIIYIESELSLAPELETALIESIIFNIIIL